MTISVIKSNFEELDINAMVSGIGRKASEEELISYLMKDINDMPIGLEEAFSKYFELPETNPQSLTTEL